MSPAPPLNSTDPSAWPVLTSTTRTTPRPIAAGASCRHVAPSKVTVSGHDPLFGLVIGTLDIMRGTVTGAGRGGMMGVGQTGMPGVRTPLAALALQVMHLL